MPAAQPINKPILEKLISGYAQKSPAVGGMLYPDVPVNNKSGKYIIFNKDFQVDHSSTMDVGRNAIPPSIDFDFSTAEYNLGYKGLAVQISTEEKEEGEPLLKIEQRKTRILTESYMVAKEKLIADTAQNDALYSASNKHILDGTPGDYYWSDTTNGDPLGDLTTAVDAIIAKIGVPPDTIIFGYDSARIASLHPEVQKLTALPTVGIVQATMQAAVAALANFLGISKYGIGMQQYVNAVTATNFSNIWADNVVLAYVGTPGDRDSQTFGVMLNRKGYPIINKSVIPRTDGLDEIRMRSCYNIHQINIDAGYLVKNTVA